MRQKLIPGLLLMVSAAFLTAVGQAFWKLDLHGLYSWQLYIGFCLYGLGAVCMTLAFQYGSFAALHPLLSLGYLFSAIIGGLGLHEVITIKLLMGDICILLGAMCLGVGERKVLQEDVGSK